MVVGLDDVMAIMGIISAAISATQALLEIIERYKLDQRLLATFRRSLAQVKHGARVSTNVLRRALDAALGRSHDGNLTSWIKKAIDIDKRRLALLQNTISAEKSGKNEAYVALEKETKALEAYAKGAKREIEAVEENKSTQSPVDLKGLFPTFGTMMLPTPIADRGGSRVFCSGAVICQQEVSRQIAYIQSEEIPGGKGWFVCKFCYVKISLPEKEKKEPLAKFSQPFIEELMMMLCRSHLVASSSDGYACYRCTDCYGSGSSRDFSNASDVLAHYSSEHPDTIIKHIEKATERKVPDLDDQLAEVETPLHPSQDEGEDVDQAGTAPCQDTQDADAPISKASQPAKHMAQDSPQRVSPRVSPQPVPPPQQAAPEPVAQNHGENGRVANSERSHVSSPSFRPRIDSPNVGNSVEPKRTGRRFQQDRPF
ncbi:hypothetical protein CABS01_11725 [Colletotrichum abscissum]|uniref:Uncharacterized protein n=1 Tax=Colletotrichum abscissum TaxID=1671311 RepID=A0A9P9XDL3_9PEZI|nr:uncharacterized protein CABS01_11725 [Colletotrichum abscissum]KAI3548693.1 hypothetical protein CABS02_08223 [Colletotrichum abscissum]KAK1492828.1 hypothetical protein CABS01_11725 [Colletotrichum abscissum]